MFSNKLFLVITSLFSKETTIMILLLLNFGFSPASYAYSKPDDMRQLLQLTEYIGVDYSAAIKDGKILDEGEYQEMMAFAAIISSNSQLLLGEQLNIVKLALSLENAVREKLSVEKIQGIATSLKKLLLGHYPEMSLPYSLLDSTQVSTLFKAECSGCHGETGQGNGLLAEQLEPKPTNFTEQERAMARSILGLYNVISGGLEGTAMTSYTKLSSKERWSLAFYTGSLSFTKRTVEDGIVSPIISLQDIIQFSPNELINSTSMINEKTVKELRANPSTFFSSAESPLVVTENQLKRVVQAYQQRDFVAAQRHAVSAYLDGFELVENMLDSKDTILRKSIESSLLGLRQIINAQSDPEQVKQSVSTILIELTKAERLLSESSMSDAALFSTSFIILLREGLEALLVIIALISILIRSNKRKAMKYVHFGWVAAILTGILTWLVAQHLVSISGASREIMEGIAALLASVVLFYVGFWMHSKTQADQWQLFIKRNINESLKAGTLWGITGLTFITVYREVFETVLFYQSLLTQAAASQEIILLAGFGTAVFVLMLFAGLMIKYSIKLPIGKFFSVTTYILLTLSFVLAGKAVSALQEAAILAISPFPMSFQVELLGINSTWQGLLLQLSILVLTIILIVHQRLRTQTSITVRA